MSHNRAGKITSNSPATLRGSFLAGSDIIKGQVLFSASSPDSVIPAVNSAILPFGVSDDDAPQGYQCAVVLTGPAQAKVGIAGGVNIGDQLMCDANSEVQTLVLGQASIGIALESGASGDLVAILVMPLIPGAVPFSNFTLNTTLQSAVVLPTILKRTGTVAGLVTTDICTPGDVPFVVCGIGGNPGDTVLCASGGPFPIFTAIGGITASDYLTADASGFAVKAPTSGSVDVIGRALNDVPGAGVVMCFIQPAKIFFSGVQSFRIPYTITPTDEANGFAVVTATFPTPFADTNYTPVYSIFDVTDPLPAIDFANLDMHNKIASSIDVVFLCVNGSAGTQVEVNMIAIHD